MLRKPIIGISAITVFNPKLHGQKVAYAEAVWGAGGEAILLPANRDKGNCKQIVSMVDGLLVPGGPDVDPVFYGEEKTDVCGKTCRYEDEYDMELIREAVKQGKPVLAICRGMQIVNILYGGTLYQDIPTQFSRKIQHSGLPNVEENYHTVILEEDSYLAKTLGGWKEVQVNTSHHQAVKDVADGFRVVGHAPDGTIEAIENKDASVLCVQWHPERMQDVEMYQSLLKDFIERCR